MTYTTPRLYSVFGDYGYQNERLLFSTLDLKEANRFLRREFTCHADFNGFEQVAICWFAEDGEVFEAEILCASDFEEEEEDEDDY